MKECYSNSKTEQNLLEAFSYEAQARSRYTFFSYIASKAGYEQLSEVLQKIGEQEREHAVLWALELEQINSTEENLRFAIENESYASEQMYERMAEEADREGFHALSEKFRRVSEIEAYHRSCLEKALSDIENGSVFTKQEEHTWECRNCGYASRAVHAPDSCPVCRHPRGYFEIRNSL